MRVFRYGCDWCDEVYTSNNEESSKQAADECCAPLDEFFDLPEELVDIDCD